MNQNVAFAKNSCHTMQSNDIARTSDINFLDSKSLIINFLVQDFESYVVQTRVNGKRRLSQRIIRCPKFSHFANTICSSLSVIRPSPFLQSQLIYTAR